MAIRDKFVARTCPQCGESPRKSKHQYLYMYVLLDCTECEIRWRSRLQNNDHFGITYWGNEKKDKEERIAEIAKELFPSK